MRLPRDGREFASWPISTSDTLTGFQVQLNPGEDWIDAVYTGGVVKLLVRGPDFEPEDGDVIESTLVAASCWPRIRCLDDLEDVKRDGGPITLL